MLEEAEQHHRFMTAALQQAALAAEAGDVPVGAVIVYGNRIIAKGCNQRDMLKDSTAHAEIIALTAACEYIGDWRLNDCTIYVTLEPCPMCAGALVLARLERLVYGCDDPKAGACGTLYNIVQDDRLNHRMEVVKGVLAEQCSGLLTGFFQGRRGQKKNSQ